jgi:hypothetical protein
MALIAHALRSLAPPPGYLSQIPIVYVSSMLQDIIEYKNDRKKMAKGKVQGRRIIS